MKWINYEAINASIATVQVGTGRINASIAIEQVGTGRINASIATEQVGTGRIINWFSWRHFSIKLQGN